MTPEQLAIAALWAALQTVVGLVVRALYAENRELKEKLDDSNEASRDLIAIQAKMLQGQGVSIISKEERGR